MPTPTTTAIYTAIAPLMDEWNYHINNPAAVIAVAKGDARTSPTLTARLYDGKWCGGSYNDGTEFRSIQTLKEFKAVAAEIAAQ